MPCGPGTTLDGGHRRTGGRLDRESLVDCQRTGIGAWPHQDDIPRRGVVDGLLQPRGCQRTADGRSHDPDGLVGEDDLLHVGRGIDRTSSGFGHHHIRTADRHRVVGVVAGNENTVNIRPAVERVVPRASAEVVIATPAIQGVISVVPLQQFDITAAVERIVGPAANPGFLHRQAIDREVLLDEAHVVLRRHLRDRVVGDDVPQLGRGGQRCRRSASNHIRQQAVRIDQQRIRPGHAVAGDRHRCLCRLRVVEDPDPVIVVAADRVIRDRQIVDPGRRVEAIRHNPPIDSGNRVVRHHHGVAHTAVDVHRVGVVRAHLQNVVGNRVGSCRPPHGD